MIHILVVCHRGQNVAPCVCGSRSCAPSNLWLHLGDTHTHTHTRTHTRTHTSHHAAHCHVAATTDTQAVGTAARATIRIQDEYEQGFQQFATDVLAADFTAPPGSRISVHSNKSGTTSHYSDDSHSSFFGHTSRMTSDPSMPDEGTVSPHVPASTPTSPTSPTFPNVSSSGRPLSMASQDGVGRSISDL